MGCGGGLCYEFPLNKGVSLYDLTCGGGLCYEVPLNKGVQLYDLVWGCGGGLCYDVPLNKGVWLYDQVWCVVGVCAAWCSQIKEYGYVARYGCDGD